MKCLTLLELMQIIDKLIQKEEETISKLSDDEKEKLKIYIETVV